MFPLRRSVAQVAVFNPKAYASTFVTRNPLPATFLRGGTSKGIYLNRADLPEDRTQWDRIFLGIMGSPDAEYGRQLNGMGGGVSSLSKICVVGAPSDEQRAQGFDVEYTFVQVGIRDSALDYSGNCGNLSSMIGVFAIDEGLYHPAGAHAGPTVTVRSFNTNTRKRIDTTFPVAVAEDRNCVPVLDLEQVYMAGVPGKASQITLDFMSPGGARTGHLLPSGAPIDTFSVRGENKDFVPIDISLVDATNPTVFVPEDSIAKLFPSLLLPNLADADFNADLKHTIEEIRMRGAVRMGLDPTAQAQPKICLLSPPAYDDVDAADIVVRAFSMGVLHKAIPMTVGLCLGVAAGVRNTLPWQIVTQARKARGVDDPVGELVRIRHPGGIVDVGASFGADGQVLSAKVVRTGRRLMKGVVWW
ncbi:Aconitate-delta-isomerase 1 [Sparassis crispa]|uniref:Aconitate-delta-isomerase 1 n=1 Tax=Sparassis crispa TaxID=139825 RepID=A0A401H0F7_9APHY|nr:Aconitate-delta-isomerase 1 [Sparassis crispa]GBE87907.1 Aconitate-delta-isomerase 1 [Sparassis crispa]